MPYDLDSKMSELYSRAVAEESQVANALSELQIPKDVVIEELAKNKDKLIQTAQSLVEQHTSTEYHTKIMRPIRIITRSNTFLFYVLILFASVLYAIFPDPIQSLYGFFSVPDKFRFSTDLKNIFYNMLAISILFFILFIYWYIQSNRKYLEIRFALSNQEKSIDDQILENGIKPFLRLYINNEKQASYETVLAIKNAPGLWSIMDTPFEVPTATKNKVERMIANLSGGSIGIAGPRGVGKSTLLSSICHPDRKKFQDVPALTIMTSVPVKYDSREFILHLYSQVCEKIIRIEGEDNPRIVRSPSQLASDRITSGFKRLLLRFSSFLFFAFLLGFCGVALSIYWVSQEIPFGKTDSPFGVLEKLLSPDELFKVSILLVSIPILLFAGQLFRFYSDAFDKFRYTPRQKGQKQIKSKSQHAMSILLVKDAEKRLEGIKYQRSFSSGWSGGVKLPEAIQFVESSSEYTDSKTRNPLSLPEIVNDYRNFLYLVAKKYKILIGIDELDKISSTEVAQQFLNETKAIFGVRGCFYLVSVSDNALSNFERRGIAFRDEFDTSFDDVLFLETPNIEYSSLLLRLRVIGLPLPFIYYCYVLSGGLPRDLIRVCREIFDIAQRYKDDVRLITITEESVISDLRSKIRAISIAATDNLVEPEASILFDYISQISLKCNDYSSWFEISNSMIINIQELTIQTATKSNMVMRRLIDELASYLLFSATIVQYFMRMGQNQTIEPLTQSELVSLEQLSRAKQLIPSSPKYSRIVISDFRKNNNLMEPQSVVHNKSVKKISTRKKALK